MHIRWADPKREIVARTIPSRNYSFWLGRNPYDCHERTIYGFEHDGHMVWCGTELGALTVNMGDIPPDRNVLTREEALHLRDLLERVKRRGYGVSTTFQAARAMKRFGVDLPEGTVVFA